VNQTAIPFSGWRKNAVASVLLALFGLAAWILPFTKGLTFFSYDLPFLFRGETRPQEALIVFMDDESRKRLNQSVEGPWNRKLHTRLLEQLFTHKARAVVFDILFDEPSKDPKVDEQFAAAIRSHGKVVLGASCHYDGGNGEPIIGRLQHAAEPLAFAAPWGVAELPADSDGAIRRHFYHEQFTNMATHVAILVGKGSEYRSVPRWINYYGPSGAIPHVSYYEALADDLFPVDTVSNKIVFVGMAPIINYQGSKSSDEFRTSYTRWTGVSSPGVEIQATAALNLLRHDWLARLSPFSEMTLIIAAAAIFGFLLPVFRPSAGIAFIFTLALVVVALGIILVLHFHLWFCWAAISLVEAPAACLWLLLPREAQTPKFSPSGVSMQPEAGPASPVSAIHSQPSQLDRVGERHPPEIPDHVMIRRFGEGSYGEVWLARTVLGQFRAVKIVYRKNFKSADPFHRELRGIQSFEPISRKHEGFVHVLQVGPNHQADYFYYVMEVADDSLSAQQIDPERYAPRTLASDL